MARALRHAGAALALAAALALPSAARADEDPRPPAAARRASPPTSFACGDCFAPAQPGPPPRPVDAADAEVIAKTARLERALREGQLTAMTWRGGWLALFSGAAIGSAVLASETTGRDSAVWRLGALRAGVGVASIFAIPFPAAGGGDRSGAVLSSSGFAPLYSFPDETPAARRDKLAAAGRRLHEAAEFERFGRSWLPHAASAAVSLSFAAWIWVGYHRPGAAALSLASGLAASEAKIFTMPTRAIDDEAALLGPAPAQTNDSRSSEQLGSQPNNVGSYLDSIGSYPNHFASKSFTPPRITWSLAPTPGGLALAGTF